MKESNTIQKVYSTYSNSQVARQFKEIPKIWNNIQEESGLSTAPNPTSTINQLQGMENPCRIVEYINQI